MNPHDSDPARHERVSRIFGRLCELPLHLWGAALDRECGGDVALRAEVESLLRQDARAGGEPGFLTTPLLDGELRQALSGERPARPDLAPCAPRRIGRYLLRRVLNAGGTSTVYEAEQAEPRRSVALKLLRPWLLDSSALLRFSAEARILGSLRHPGIAQIYEAGTHVEADVEIPYFVMELVPDSLSLTEYARARGLGVPERIRLFTLACSAVHYAHSRGVIHRDLKPANILVDSCGQPKVLDFGVARAISSRPEAATLLTMEGQIVGTLTYMSPEQISGDSEMLGTSSDVYSLGVILFELLTEKLPLDLADKSLAETAQAIRTQEPLRASSVRPGLDPELDLILAKALAKESDRRYSSAAELAADLERHLADEPILARPPSAIYQLRKLARRHRAAFFAAYGALASLLIGAVAAAALAAEASVQRDSARFALEQTRLVSTFVEDVLFADVRRELQAIDVAERGHAALESDTIQHPAARAMLHDLVGRAYKSERRFEDSIIHLREALDLQRELHGDESLQVADAWLRLHQTYATGGRFEEARAAVHEAFVARRAALGPDHLITNPDNRYRHSALEWLPDEPEAAVARQQSQIDHPKPGDARLREGPVVRFHGPLLFEDQFEDAAVEQRWQPRREGISAWTASAVDSGLRFEDLIPAYSADLRRQRLSLWLERELPSLGDFRVVFRFRWSSGKGSEESSPAVMETVALRLDGSAGRSIAVAGFTDGWTAWRGERVAHLGDATCGSGFHTMPYHGHAEVEIHRVGDRMTAYWDGEPLSIGRSAEPATDIRIQISAAFGYAVPGEPDPFGALELHYLRVEGHPSSERAAE